ncbi:hypothetical protein XA68_13333 [Ophiocordyceps unilateralis]|uniref:Berberine/berberine-like domain-containing protein n=1 Tax=Ophiocordyceps unilateralis TaxID=268505 RepID=A0A2A9PCZ5_OPHUN|nr:hypothetical protein XA68_13333 [Ophiocordyceps unilateralis]
MAEQVSKNYGTNSPWLYLNYAAPTQQPLCGYGADNLAFLKKTAAAYDPDAVFQNLMPAGFKVSRANCSFG